MKIALIIPTLNAGPWLDRLVFALQNLNPKPDKILFVDSSSDDGTGEAVIRAGFDLHTIRREEFGHGPTRNLAARLCAGHDILIYMTHDAIPGSADIVKRLSDAFANPAVAIVCGRQLPHTDATAAASYARLTNYPGQSRRITKADIPSLGVKALFCSNSFAAYRASVLTEVGGFPEALPLGEDMAVTGRILDAGHVSLYLAEACVYHSHNYTPLQEFRRYFDIGALLQIDPWLSSHRLKSGGAGLRYVLGEFEYMLRRGNIKDITEIFPRTLAKYFGFQLGRRYKLLPASLRLYLGMQKNYWKKAA